MVDLLEKSEKIRKEADDLLVELDLINILKPYGKVEMTGSYLYDLMIWRDLDMDVVTQSELNTEQYLSAVSKLFHVKNVEQLRLVDNRDGRKNNRPVGIWLGVHYRNKLNKLWKLDIWFLTQKDQGKSEMMELIKQKLTPDYKLLILDIKNQVCDHPGYHKTFSSVDVYKAVLEEGIVDVEEFRKLKIKD